MTVNGTNTIQETVDGYPIIKPFRVNTVTSDDQQYASVAMDSDGDVVVVWESYNQDGDGWGIFGRRFITNGLSYGYQNTIQKLQFIGSIVTGDTMRLTIYTDSTHSWYVDVPLYVKMNPTVEAIKHAMVGKWTNTETGEPKQLFAEQDVDVTLSSSDEITVEFKGKKTGTYVDILTAEVGRSGLTVNVEMRQKGIDGVEFSVNETTENNQRFASIGMEPNGSFVVSWTSWGQDSDSAIESNIYARKFASNHVLSSDVSTIEDMTSISTEYSSEQENPILQSDVDESFVLTIDDINYHQVYAGQGYDSVCMITVSEGTAADLTVVVPDPDTMGSGSLLTTRYHVLTAAHVVCDENGVPLDPKQDYINCMFETPSGIVNIRVDEIYVHPTYVANPDYSSVDLAVLVLSTPAPSSLKGYELYTGNGEIGQQITFVGYGTYGDIGDTADEWDSRGYGVKHIGQNVYELTGASFNFNGPINPNTLVYDFDDGTYANDYLGNYYGVRNLGLGTREARAARGVSRRVKRNETKKLPAGN